MTPSARKPSSPGSSTRGTRDGRHTPGKESRAPARWKPPKWTGKFLKMVANGHTFLASCEAVGIAYATMDSTRRRHPEFDAAVHQASELGIQRAEEEMRLRAVDGRDRPVFQGGAKVGDVRERSDDLLKFMLRARRPYMYRDNVRVEHTGADGGPIETRELIDGKDPAQLQPETRRRIAEALAAEAEIIDADVVE